MQSDDMLSRLMARVLRVVTAAAEETLDELQLEKVVDGVLGEAEGLSQSERASLRVRLLKAFRGDDGKVYEIVPSVCSCSPDASECEDRCAVKAIRKGSDGRPTIDHELCVECGLCMRLCKSGAVSARSACVDLVSVLRHATQGPVYAMLAPSFAGQFGPEATPESLRLALRRLGFTDVVEVALAADVTTVMEAHEYIERMSSDRKFMITSCCCPAFVKLVNKHRPNVRHLVSHSVSPMVACAKMLKAREPHAKTVFIGPCLAKRSEAREVDHAGAVDLVLTFRELADLLEAAEIDPTADFDLRLSGFSDASHDGRIYARTGGVTEAISSAVHELRSDLTVIGVKGNGLRECSNLLERIELGDIEANFMEGMACPGGCVGGPGTLIGSEEGAVCANAYADAAPVRRAMHNAQAQSWYEEQKASNDLVTRRSTNTVYAPS